MKSTAKILLMLVLATGVVLTAGAAYAADSVDVVFRYTIAGSPTGVSVPGEFNNWTNTAWPMTFQGGNLWARTARLAVGGKPGGGIVGAWQYKFFYNGVSAWPNDPLNHHVNHSDNDNSFLYVKDPTIYQFIPNQRNPVVNSATPAISAYIFPKVGSTVDTSTLSLTIDGTIYGGIGSSLNVLTNQLTFIPTDPLPNGSHTVILHAGTNADTVTFTTQSGFVQLLNHFPFTTRKTSWTLNGVVQDTGIASVKIVRNGVDTFTTPVTNKAFTFAAPLTEGNNSFIAVVDSSGIAKNSSPVNYTRHVNHAPVACATLGLTPDRQYLVYDGSCSSDPDSNTTLSYLWLSDSTNPEPLGIDGAPIPVITTLTPPRTPGEYHASLVVTDNDNNKDTTGIYFEVDANKNVRIPTYFETPAWAQKGRIYFLFPKAVSPAGTINAAAARLQNIKDLGFNIIWMMPVMVNAFPINNDGGPGYNITDFYNVAPEYGTNLDFKNFVAQAHALGIKVILDVTPNHSSRFHPWSADAHTYKTNSVYWSWYEHATITSNTNGLGDCLDADGFNYYCGFSEQLMNFNWSDPDMRAEMINVYKYWITQMGVDGYRLDVYWGPHRRYGEAYMGKPVRDALKHIKPDILLLGEDDGTGAGTEVIYADRSTGGVNGGLDAAYDFKLYFNQIKGFNFSSPGISALHNEIDNGGFYPGPNSLYMRFMESQDEDRITYFYSNNFAIDSLTTWKRTMPMASVLFTIPGLPMIWNGQDVGWGYGIPGSKDARTRSVVNWNYSGKNVLSPHYQKLAHIRAQFPAFTQHKRDTNNDGLITSADATDFVLESSSSGVYAFARPWTDQNGLTVANFTASPQTVNLFLHSTAAMKFTGGIQDSQYYYVNDLYGNSRWQVQGIGLVSVPFTVPAFGTGIYTISTTADSVTIENPLLDVRERSTRPSKFALAQNYPNPFNPATNIEFNVAKSGPVQIKVYDMLGREVATIVDENLQPGAYTRAWNAGNLASGVYFYRLISSSFLAVKKMMLIR
jgi:glycosidase